MRRLLLGYSAICCVLLFTGRAAAQTIPAPHSNLDANGVDLVTGGTGISGYPVTIGDPSQGGLSRVMTGTNSAGAQSDNFSISLNVSGATYTVTAGAITDPFTLSGGVFTENIPSGGSLSVSGGVYTYTDRNGATTTFGPTASVVNSGVSNNIYLATLVKQPSGDTLTFNYVSLTPVAGYVMQRLQSVTNNLGYMIKYTYQADTGTVAAALNVTQVMAINNAIDYCNPTADACPALTVSWPKNTYGLPGDGSVSEQDSIGNGVNYWTNSGIMNASQIFNLGQKYVEFNAAGKVDAVLYRPGSDGWTYAYSTNGNIGTTTVTDGLGHTRVVTSNLALDVILTDTDGNGHTTTYSYDTYGRLTGITYPEGNSVGYVLDARGNVTQTIQTPKSGSGLAVINTYANYDATCTYIVKCNKPNSTTDALGNVTYYGWDTTYGVSQWVVAPPPIAGANPPTTWFGYQTLSAYYLNSSGALVAGSPVYRPYYWTACATLPQSTCGGGTAGQTMSVVGYAAAGAPNNLLPYYEQIYANDGSINSTSYLFYDSIGNLTSVQGPLGAAQTTVNFFDADRHLVGTIGPDPDGAGLLPNRAIKYDYITDNLLSGVEVGTTNGQTAAAWANFSSSQQVFYGYALNSGAFHRKNYDAYLAGGVMYAETLYGYGSDLLLQCVNVRMNPSGAAGASNCQLGTAGSDGPDHITYYSYDAANQLTQVTSGYGTSSPINDVTYTYGANGEVATVADGKGNLTTYGYDGFLRRTLTYYPNPSNGTVSSTTDYEQLTYDANSRVTQDRRRDGTVVTLGYDNLNRLTTGPRGETLAYDNFNRLTSASYGGITDSFTYDALSRQTSRTDPFGTINYQYDAAGRRTRATWPDGLYITDVYDWADDLTAVEENGATSGVGLLASYAYDNLGRKTSLSRGNGLVTNYSYDAISQLSGFTHNYPSPYASYSPTVSLARGANGQIESRTWTNGAFNWSGGVTATHNYLIDGQNQVSTNNAATLSYDLRGNLISDGVNSYTYDVVNNLATAGTSHLYYDALGRLYQTSGSSVTSFGYDGAQAVAEYGAGNALLRRYVPEAGVWYEGSSTTDRRWMIGDERGSVIAVTNTSGANDYVNTYDEYGIPGASNGGRFQYTGQMWIPEMGLYHYNARAYSPTLGRFMQTDPIGFDGGMNIYAYAGSDPINAADPSGLIKCENCNNLPPDPHGDTIGNGSVGEVVVTGIPYGPRCFGCERNVVNDFALFGFGRDPGIAMANAAANLFRNASAAQHQANSAPQNGIKQAICRAIPDARTASVTGGLGGIGSGYASGTALINYNTGTMSLYGTGGAQLGWNGGASATASAGVVYGLGGDNGGYSGAFTGANASIPAIPVGINGQTGGGVTEVGLHIGANLTPLAPSGGITRSVTSRPFNIGNILTSGSLFDISVMIAKNLACH